MSWDWLKEKSMSHYDLFGDCGNGRGNFYLKECPETGLRAVIAISHPDLGPALGGCRFAYYPNTLSAMIEASRLANTMLLKSAFHDLPFSGGKAVLIAPNVLIDRVAYFKAFGRFVDSLGGAYVTAMDSGVGKADMNAIASCTTYATNFCKIGGAPSAYTAKGVSLGIEAAVAHVLGRDSLEGVRVLIQGVGKVGYELLKRMVALGAKVTISDKHAGIVKKCMSEFSVQAVDPADIYTQSCDVFAPCAMGSGLNMKTLALLKAKIIAGAANNPFSDRQQVDMLHARGIVYIPDYVLNAGGLIFSARQFLGSQTVSVEDKIEAIYNATRELLEQSDKLGLPPLEVAGRIAKRKMLIAEAVAS